MELKEVLMKRRSVRKFTEEAVSDECIDELMHAAMSGPSACNKMPWEFYCITDSGKLEQLYGAAHYSKIKAPLAIVVVGNKERFLPMHLSSFWVQDCSAATENILLRAVDLELGTVWCGIYPQKSATKKVAKVLSLSGKQIPLNIIYVGHPAEFPEERDQYDEKLVHFVK